MVKKIIFLITLSWFAFIGFAQSTGQYTVVTNDDQILKVYNLDINREYVYYTIKEDDSDDIKRIPVSNILIIKDAEGNKIDPARNAVSSLSGSSTEAIAPQNTVSLAKHQPRPEIIWQATGETFQDKKKPLLYEASSIEDPENRLWFTIIDETNKKIELVRAPKKKVSHPSEEFIIPDYVIIDGSSYKVTSIGKETFYSFFGGFGYKNRIKKLSLPETLEEIGESAFGLAHRENSLILPSNLKKIGNRAFKRGGIGTISELYIPKTIESIGSEAFLLFGENVSPKGYYQGVLTCIPDFITTDNCHSFGIDENAIENYERRIGLRKD